MSFRRLIVYGERIDPTSVLEGMRGEIYRVVSLQPGLCTTEIARKSQTGRTNADFHLDTLKRLGYVAERQGPRGRRCYFPIDSSSTFDGKTLMARLRDPSTQNIFEYILDHGGAKSMEEVARALNLPYGRVNFHITEMAKTGMIFKKHIGNKCRLEITPKMAEAYELAKVHFQ